MAVFNQTRLEWVANLLPQERGNAILLTAVDQGNKQSLKAALVGHITYEACQELARNAVAFKWIPERIATFDQLRASDCHGDACTDTCVKPGCICSPTGVCVKASS